MHHKLKLSYKFYFLTGTIFFNITKICFSCMIAPNSTISIYFIQFSKLLLKMLYKMPGRKYVSSNHFYFTASSVKVTNFPANAIPGDRNIGARQTCANLVRCLLPVHLLILYCIFNSTTCMCYNCSVSDIFRVGLTRLGMNRINFFRPYLLFRKLQS
jgi:hypothetical protein